MTTVSARIENALRLQPMTIKQLTPAVFSTTRHVRKCIEILKQEGRIRRGQVAPRTQRMGRPAYFWERIA